MRDGTAAKAGQRAREHKSNRAAARIGPDLPNRSWMEASLLLRPAGAALARHLPAVGGLERAVRPRTDALEVHGVDQA